MFIYSPSCPFDFDVNSVFLGLFVIIVAATVVKVPDFGTVKELLLQ